MFQNCISASKKCNSCWVRLRGSAGWCTIFCCTILHTRLALDCTCCAIAIARTRIATNCTGCKITSLQTADRHTIAPDYCSDACNWCATAAAEHHRHCRNFALLYLRHTERCATEVQSWTKCGTRSCGKVHWNCTKVLQHWKNAQTLGNFAILLLLPSLTSQLAWHFRRLCRSLQDCATKNANHLSAGNVGQHIMPIHVLLLSSYTESTLVRLSNPLAAGSDLFKHVSWENLTKSTPTDNMATLQCFFHMKWTWVILFFAS